MHRTQTYVTLIAAVSIFWLCDELTSVSMLHWAVIAGFALVCDWLREMWW